MLRKLCKDILTGVDNETYDISRVLCLMAHGIYFALAIASFVIEKPWAPLDFASGIGTMAVGFGVNLHLKRATEPGAGNG